MAYSNNLITAPVSIYDVQRALSKSSPDLATLCVANSINKWARYKPERADGPMPLICGTVTEGTRSRKANNFGLDVPYCTQAIMNEKVFNLINHNETGWDYLKPRGDLSQTTAHVNEFYRLTDFAHLPSSFDPNDNNTLTGYNHNAIIPFDTSFNANGMVWSHDTDGDFLYINTSMTNQIVITFTNSNGNDLHLQDFVDIPQTIPSDNKTWRPVLQIFRTYYDQDSGHWVHWSDNDQPFMEIAGQPITSNLGDSVSVAVNLNDSRFIPFIGVNESFYLCVGVGCCNQSEPILWKDPNGPLFIVPYEEDQLESDMTIPFFYRFKLVNINAMGLDVTAMQFYADGITRWVDAGGTPPYFTIHSLATGAIFLTINLSNISQALDFVTQETDREDTGYAMFKIQVKESVSGTSGETTKYLTPATSNRNNTNHVHISAGSDATIYANLFIADIPLNGYGRYYLYASTGGSAWYNIGYFSIQKVRYSNS